MSQINRNIILIFMLLGLSLYSQDNVNDDPETMLNSINYHIAQAQADVDNGNYYNAQKKLEEALKQAEKINDKKSIGLIHSKIGKIHYLLEEPTDAMVSLTKAVEVQRFAKDYLNIADTYKTLGNVHMLKENYEEALDYYKSAKSLFEQENLDNFVAEILLFQGKAYNGQDKFREARTVLEQCVAQAKRLGLKEIHSNALVNLGKAQLELGKNDEALQLASEGYNIARANSFPTSISEGLIVLSDINNKIGNIQASNNYLKAYIKFSDSLLEARRLKYSPEKRMQLLLDNQSELQKKQIADLEQEKEEYTLGRLITILSVALITILSLLTLSLYKNNNIRLKTNNMLHKKNAELIVAKEKAELASKTKANFLSTVTHELRTPLYAVTGITNMLLDENPKPDQVQHLKSLKFSGEYLLTFINDILQINKIEANKVDLEPEVFNLKKKIENVISALNNSALDNNIKIHFDYDKQLPNVFKADQLKISQILINLIGNAIKFTKDGDIWVRTYKIGQKDSRYHVRFEIEDNGIGITKEKQENMFESFSQGSIQINRKYGGTGLGLSIVKGLIDILKGKIYLKSELGKGSTFFFEIPLEHTNEAVSEKKIQYFKDVKDIDLENIKILVVEDNKINQMITKKILNKMNLYCDLTDNGEEAVDMVKNNNYDVVLMDIHMPGISGMEATRIIRTFDKELTIFALTAVTLEDKMQEFDEAGFDDIISKPFKQEDFEKKLFNALMENKQNTAKEQ